MQCTNKKCAAELVENATFCHVCGKKQITVERDSRKRGNGQGSVFKGKTGYIASVVKYYYTDENGKRRPKRVRKHGFKTKKEAIEYLPILRNAKEKKMPTLDELWQGYEPSLDLLSKDKQTAYKAAKKKMESIFHTPIDALTINDLQAIVDEKSTSHYTAKDLRTVLSHLYNRAVAQGNITANITKYIAIPALEESEPIPFNKEEQSKFWELSAADDWFAPYILLMIYTGMMPGELMKARKDMIDWDQQRIVGGGLKTGVRKITPIVLPDTVIPVLQKICENKGDKLIHVNKDKFYTEYYKCLERAGARKLPPYSCRHTTGTALGTSDIPIAIVKEIMRHSKITTTQRYIHVDTATMLDAANKIGA